MARVIRRRLHVYAATRLARAGGLIIRSALVLAVLAPVVQASEQITLNGPWTRHVEGEEPYEFGVPEAFEPIDGPATYVRKFTLSFDFPDSVAILRFDAVSGHATVYLNDVLLGEHEGFTPFWFEVANILRPQGEENELIVVINDHRDAKTIPYEDIPWVHYSGIIRDVSIKFSYRAAILRSRIQYSFEDSSYQGVHGEVSVDLVGQPGEEVNLSGGIWDGPMESWTLAASYEASAPVSLDETGRGRGTLEFFLDSPRLWSPDNPDLYSLWVAASIEELVVDQTLDTIGFRDIAVDREDIVLNGEPIFLKGICRHDLYGQAGFFGTDEQMEEDMFRIKQTGANYVRLIHYPQHTKILDLADRLGLMVSCEIPAWANFFDPEIRERLYTMYEEMILRDMNHPSVIMWLSGNARARPMPYAAEAQQLAKSLDRNRLASYVIDNDEYHLEAVEADVAFIKEAQLDVYLKITFWLYYLEFLQDAWTNFPKDLPIVLAELGFEGDNRGPVVITPEGEELEVTEAIQAEKVNQQLEGWRPHLPFYSHEHISGMAIYNWQDLDWPDIIRHLPDHAPHVRFGLVYEDREPKQVLGTVTDFYTDLPTTWVGNAAATDSPLAELFDPARNLSDLVNNINRDSGPAINTARNRLYFASDGPDYVSLPKLMVTDVVDGQWQPPRLLDIPQETELTAFRRAPCISFDETTLYFTRGVLTGIIIAQTRIWESHYVDGRWNQPVDMGEVINYPDPVVATSDPSVSADGTMLYFSSDRPGGVGGTDLWVSHREDGQWQLPENLGPVVNSPHNDAEPTISTDGRTLYFTSSRPGGMGSSDIWGAYWVDGEWTEPANLGPRVNSVGADREPEVSIDGVHLFFTGIRDGGMGLSDLWVASLKGAAAFTETEAVTIEIISNNPGTVIIVMPSDIDHLASGIADPGFTRRFRQATPLICLAPPIYNGLDFWRWKINGEAQPTGQSEFSVVTVQDVRAEAEYVIPVSVAIIGETTLVFDGGVPSAEERGFSASVSFLDGSSQTVRSGIRWSVDDEAVATIDADAGILRPRPMSEPAEVTVFVEAEVAGFTLPQASARLRLQGRVASERAGEDVEQPRTPLCGVLGAFCIASMFAALVLLRISGCRR